MNLTGGGQQSATKDGGIEGEGPEPLHPLRRVKLEHSEGIGKMYAYTVDDEEFLSGISFGLWGVDSRVRQTAFVVVHSKLVEGIVLITILAQSFMLVLSIPGDRGSFPTIMKYETMLDGSFLLIFTAEMVLRMIALGAVRGQHAYSKSMWNQLDGTVVILSWLEVAMKALNKNVDLNPKMMRMLRFMRPFRTVRLLPLVSCCQLLTLP